MTTPLVEVHAGVWLSQAPAAVWHNEATNTTHIRVDNHLTLQINGNHADEVVAAWTEATA